MYLSKRKIGIAVNLAVALAKKCELKVGLLDADVFGPSVPMMMKILGKPEVNKGACRSVIFILTFLLKVSNFKTTSTDALFFGFP